MHVLHVAAFSLSVCLLLRFASRLGVVGVIVRQKVPQALKLPFNPTLLDAQRCVFLRVVAPRRRLANPT